MSDEIKVLVNPYNFNNKLITKNDIQSLLERFEIKNEINSIEHYQTAFVHNSYIKKSPSELGDNVVICEKPEGALEQIKTIKLNFSAGGDINSYFGKIS